MTTLTTATPRGVTTDRLAAELRAGLMVVRRELLHFARDRARSLVVLVQPLLFLFVLGVGLARLIEGVTGTAGTEAGYLVFLFPGVLVMAVQAPAISVGASIVWDRENGFLREMLVAPVYRSTLLIGKCVGGALVAAVQGLLVLACAGLVGIPYRLGMMVASALLLLLAALTMTALGALVAVCIRRVTTFNTVLNLMMTPLIFLSGLMFPISAMPAWLQPLGLVNPLTYIVDALRRTIAAELLPEGAPPALFTPVSWAGWTVPVGVEIALVAAATVAAVAVGARRFARLG
jgi:ABC-2 type transport system permease protein